MYAQVRVVTQNEYAVVFDMKTVEELGIFLNIVQEAAYNKALKEVEVIAIDEESKLIAEVFNQAIAVLIKNGELLR